MRAGVQPVCSHLRRLPNVLYVLPGVQISQLNRQNCVFFLLREWANAVQRAGEVTIETSLLLTLVTEGGTVFPTESTYWNSHTQGHKYTQVNELAQV